MDDLEDDLPLSRPLTMQDVRLAVRTAAESYGSRQFTIVGRGSLAASMPESADKLRSTIDIDLFPPWDETKAGAWAAVDTNIGRYSLFQEKNGFYVERVGEWTLMTQAAGWNERAMRLEVDGIEILVLHPLDLAYNKLEAGREKDIVFMREGLNCKAYDFVEVRDFVHKHAPDPDTRELILENLRKAAF